MGVEILLELIQAIIATYTLSGAVVANNKTLDDITEDIRKNGFTPQMDELLLQYFPQLVPYKEAFEKSGQLTQLFYRAVIETATDQYSVKNVGLVAKATITSIFNGVASALGLTITDELPEEKYTEVLDNLGVDVNTTTEVMITNDGTAEAPTYRAHVSEEQLKDMFRAMWDAGFFATGGVVHSIPTAPGLLNISVAHEVTLAYFKELMKPAQLIWALLTDTVVEAMYNSVATFNETFNATDVSINMCVGSYGTINYRINLFNKAVPYTIDDTQWGGEYTQNYANYQGLYIQQGVQIPQANMHYFYGFINADGTVYPQLNGVGFRTTFSTTINDVLTIGTDSRILGRGQTFNTSSFLTTSMPGVTGVLIQDGATLPASEVLNIDELFGGWASRAKTVTNIDEFGELVDYRMLPIDIGLTDTVAGTLGLTQAEAQEGAIAHVGDAVIAGSLAEALAGTTYVDALTRTEVKTVPLEVTIPAGETPPLILPVDDGSAGLFRVYNPSRAQLNTISAYLWQSSIISQIQQIFQSAYDAVVSLHEIYVDPITSGSDYIRYGGLYFSQDTATGLVPIVANRYTAFTYPTVDVYGLFANSLDYAPYVSMSLYLPFIGIVQLNVNDVMDGQIEVSYIVDVVTGCCVAHVYVIKFGAKQLLYSFEGSCSIQLPVTGREHVLKSELGLLGTMVAGATALSGGGALAGLTAVQGLTSAGGVPVVHKGSTSANAGAVSPRLPYLIINHSESAVADGYYAIEGGDASETVKLGDCKGYTKVRAVHLDGIACTTTEKQEIEALLMGGVIL